MTIFTLQKQDGAIIRIASSESEFTDTLFHPIDGKHTADGYLLPPRKREQRLIIGNQLFCLNAHGCLVKGNYTEEGIRWQHQIDFKYGAHWEMRDALAIGQDKIGRFFK